MKNIPFKSVGTLPTPKNIDAPMIFLLDFHPNNNVSYVREIIKREILGPSWSRKKNDILKSKQLDIDKKELVHAFKNKKYVAVFGNQNPILERFY